MTHPSEYRSKAPKPEIPEDKGERTTLLIVILAVVLGWGFFRLAAYATSGETHSLDEKLVLAFRNPGDLKNPWGPGWFEEVVRDITALGGNVGLTFITLATLGFLLIERRRATALVLALAVIGGLLLSLLLKNSFDRPRPELVPHGMYVLTKSFPSGHSMMSTITFLTLAAVMARIVERRAVKAYILGVAIFLSLLVGVSRVYLGVHWPTDVLAGWAVGAFWALLAWDAMRKLQKEGKVEPGTLESPPPEAAEA